MSLSPEEFGPLAYLSGYIVLTLPEEQKTADNVIQPEIKKSRH